MSNLLEQKNDNLTSGFQVAEPDAPEARHNSRRWLFAVALTLILASLVSVLLAISHFAYSAYSAGYQSGRFIFDSAWQAGASYLIWRFVLKKKGTWLLVFSLLLFESSVQCLISTIRDARLREEAALISLLKSYFKGEQINREIEAKKYGSMAPLAILLNDFIVQLDNDSTSMAKELETQHMEAMLTKETFQDSNEIISAQKRLQEVYRILDEYEARFRTRFDEMPKSIMGLDLPQQEKEEFLADYNETKDQGLKDLLDIFTIDRSIASLLNNVLDLVKSKKGKYRLEGEEIIFYATEDADRYDSYLQEIDRLEEQRDGLIEKSQHRAETELQKLEK